MKGPGAASRCNQMALPSCTGGLNATNKNSCNCAEVHSVGCHSLRTSSWVLGWVKHQALLNQAVL